MCICNYEAKNDTKAVSNEHTLVFCLKPSLKVRMQTVLEYTFLLPFSISFIRRVIEMDKHRKSVRFLIQYGRYDKLISQRLFWKFYNTILNDTYEFYQTPFGRSRVSFSY